MVIFPHRDTQNEREVCGGDREKGWQRAVVGRMESRDEVQETREEMRAQRVDEGKLG